MDRDSPAAHRAVRIENPDEVGNTAWQSRAVEPTAYENALADALEQAFEHGAQSLEQIVYSLNAQALADPDQRAWTVDRFRAAMARLGA